MTEVIGLTGGIASGKTTISNYFRTFDIPVVDADLIASQVMIAGTPTVMKISQHFGEEVILENGEINRKRLGEIIFSSAEKREQLNNIVQETIRKEILAEKEYYIEKNYPLIVLDIPLLYEVGFEQEVDQVLVVYVDILTQKKRLLQRNPHLSEKDTLDRINSQMPLEEKVKKADFVIDNNGSINESIKQVDRWLDQNFEKDILKRATR